MPDDLLNPAPELDHVAKRLRVAALLLARELRQTRGDDLPDNHYAVLGVLSKHESMSVGALAAHERVRPPSMTRIVNALVRDGLVTRTTCPDDGRQVLVELTGAGRERAAQVRGDWECWLADAVAGQQIELCDLDRALDVILKLVRR